MANTLSPAQPANVPRFLAPNPGPRPAIRAEVEQLEALCFDGFELDPLGVTIGAVISGVELAKLDDSTFAEIHRAWLAYKVLFFRNQHLSSVQQIELGERFGELDSHPFLDRNLDHAQIVRLEKGQDVTGFENLWHSDGSFRERPALATVLRSIEVPRYGGDTVFADMVTAYAGLDDDWKERIDGLRAVHDFSQSFGRTLDAQTLATRQREFPPVSHPVVRIHPETGRKILYVNSVQVSHIEGLAADEGALLLDTLCRQATVPEYQCRFRWNPGSVAIWDNRAVQHYAASDYWPQRRVMERVESIGDRPV